MEEPRPHVVMIVANDVSTDSRVRRMAHDLAISGPRVTVLGISPTDKRELRTLGEAMVLLLPISTLLRSAPRRSLFATNSPVIAERIRLETELFNIHQREEGARIGWLRKDYFADRKDRFEVANERESNRLRKLRSRGEWLKSGVDRAKKWEFRVPRALVVKALRLLQRLDGKAGHIRKSTRLWRLQRRERTLHSRLNRDENRIRRRLSRVHRSYERKAEKLKRRIVLNSQQTWWRRTFRRPNWRRDIGALHDYEAAFGPELDRLKPDVIHAHDVHLLGVAARAASRANVGGRSTKLIYDAHEYVQGLSRYSPRMVAAWTSLEREYIGRADRVITVSPPLAQLLADDYGLDHVPTVVMNIPATSQTEVEDIRTRIGLAEDEPLVVYSGGLDEARGVHTLVIAVGELEDAHLALVSRAETSYVRELRSIADEGGFTQRLHILPFVEPHQVVSHLRSATIGVHPLVSGPMNHEIALPNKLFEYIHAGLPVVVSDCKAMAAIVQELGIGEVFTAEDEGSLVQALDRILDDPGQYRERYETNADLLSHYTWRNQREQMLRVYQGLFPGYSIEFQRADRTSMGIDQPTVRTASKVGIGPMNIAGQPWYWAKAIEKGFPGVNTEVFEIIRNERLRFPADLKIDPQIWRSFEWQLEWARQVESAYSHVLLESGMGILGSLNGGSLTGDVPFLQAHGIHFAAILHGSEAREPDRHRELVEHSPFQPDWSKTEILRRTTEDLLGMLRDFHGPIFVSTLDLLDYVPDAMWLPQVIDTQKWRPVPFQPGRKPRVLFAPTDPILKGQKYVEDIGRQLEEEGLIQLTISKRVAPEKMPDLMGDHDILIDGLVLGLYGTTAVEGMARGRLVLANISRIIDRQPATPPIIDVNPDTLEKTLRAIAEDPGDYRDVADEGPRYVRTFHDGSYAAARLARFLGFDEESVAKP